MRTALTIGALFIAGGLAACDKVSGGDDGGTGNPDGGTTQTCPGALPSAAVTCTAAECSATSGTKSFGEATMAASEGKSWIIPVSAVSEVAGANDNATIDYTQTVQGALQAGGGPTSASLEQKRKRSREFLGDAYDVVLSPERVARVRAEAELRARQSQAPIAIESLKGTAVRGRSREFLPPGAIFQAQACSQSAPSCGASMLCVIPENTTDGTCESALTLKFRTGGANFDPVNATVKKVGTNAAIVVDDGDAAALSEADASTILDRFDQHIAPLDHQFFGTPRDAQGHDRDGNGVVILFFTSKVATLGASLVGFFQSDDLRPTAEVAGSNAADILYMQPPGANVTVEGISGTIGHEYQHLINYYQKKILRQSGPEEVWLDEGLATFAEDMLGYGGDSFDDIAAYLGMVDQTSLTGAGLIGTEDSNQRRGMAHLLVRYLFEQAGGATFGSDPGMVTDKGGVAAVKKLVQSADTGTLLFTQGTTGRSFQDWVGDLLATVAVSNANFDGVSCNPKYSFAAPETDAFTHNQRGINLRASYTNAKGMSIALHGPLTADLGNDTGVAIPANGGEIRTQAVASGSVKMSVAGSADYQVAFRPIPTSK